MDFSAERLAALIEFHATQRNGRLRGGVLRLGKEVNQMDSIVGTNGFIGIALRDGRRQFVPIAEVSSLRERREGGTAIHLENDRVLLVNVTIDEVLAALAAAKEGVCDARA